MFVPAYPRRRGQDARPLWDQPAWPAIQGGGAVVAIPTAPGCQGRPTVLLPTFDWTAADFDTYPDASCYPWGEEAPLWAGEARGLFRFNAHAIPSRTHGGLASQAAIETRLGRSIPDPTDPEGEVYYWNEYPRVFHVRNNSGVTVDAKFTRTGGCAAFTQQVLDGQEFELGPFYGDASHVLAQIIGPTTATGGAPTVPTGADVKVTAPTIADPGETFDFSCQTPALVQLSGFGFDETLEGVGYAETWDGGETVTGTATLDEDAAAPAGAPTWWGSEALRVTIAASGETAYVRESTLGNLASSWETFGLYVASHTLTTGQFTQVLQLRQAAGQEILTAFLVNDGGQLSLRFQVSDANSPTDHYEPIAVTTFYAIEFRWDSDADEFELHLNGAEVASGSIIENPADYALDEVDLGAGTAGTNEPSDYYVGRFTVSAGRAGYL